MRTTLDLDKELLEEAQKELGAPTKTAAIEMALRAVVQHAAAKRIAALGGKFPHLKAPPRKRPFGR